MRYLLAITISLLASAAHAAILYSFPPSPGYVEVRISGNFDLGGDPNAKLGFRNNLGDLVWMEQPGLGSNGYSFWTERVSLSQVSFVNQARLWSGDEQHAIQWHVGGPGVSESPPLGSFASSYWEFFAVDVVQIDGRPHQNWRYHWTSAAQEVSVALTPEPAAGCMAIVLLGAMLQSHRSRASKKL